MLRGKSWFCAELTLISVSIREAAILWGKTTVLRQFHPHFGHNAVGVGFMRCYPGFDVPR